MNEVLGLLVDRPGPAPRSSRARRGGRPVSTQPYRRGCARGQGAGAGRAVRGRARGAGHAAPPDCAVSRWSWRAGAAAGSSRLSRSTAPMAARRLAGGRCRRAGARLSRRAARRPAGGRRGVASGSSRRQRDQATEDGRAFVQGLQQLSGPLMAKSVEDTAFYRYPRLLALNEVGGEPDSEGLAPESVPPAGGAAPGAVAGHACWPRPPTTPSAARTAAPGWPC